MRHLTILFLLTQLFGCSSAIITAASNDSTEQKIKDLKKMDLKEINRATTYEGKKCYTALDCALKKRDYYLTKALLEMGADPMVKRNGDKYPFPLQRVASDKKMNHDQVVNFTSLLLDHKANPNICTSKMETPINSAIKKENFRAISMLLRAGAPANQDQRCASNLRRPSPLYTSIFYGSDSSKQMKEIIRLLLQYGADPYDIKEQYSPHKTAVDLAKSRNKKSIAKFIDDYFMKSKKRDEYIAKMKVAREKRAAYIKRLQVASAERERRKKERAKYRKQQSYRQAEVIDDSNKWAGSSGSAANFINAFAGAYKSSKPRAKKKLRKQQEKLYLYKEHCKT